MLDNKEKFILKSKLLETIEHAAYYEKLCSNLRKQDTRPCTLKTAKAEYKDLLVIYDTLYNLILDLCPQNQGVYQWLELTNEDKEAAIAAAIAKAHKAIDWYKEDEPEEIPF